MFAGFIYEIKKNRFMYLLVLPGILSFVIFSYIPMAGIVIAFQDYNIINGIFHSPFVGFTHFIDFFSSTGSFNIIRNTVLLNGSVKNFV